MSTRLVLRWHTGALGCLFLPMLGGALLFAIAAVDPAMIADMAAQHRGGFLIGGQSGAFNWIAVVIAMVLLGGAAKTGWRWADQVAVRADERGLVFHRSILRKALKWREIRAVSYAPLRRTGLLAVHTTAGDTFTIRQVDPATGPEFARAVSERWLALPPPPPDM